MAYSYYSSITIDYTKCGTADSTNFPVCVSFTNSNLAVVSSGGYVQNSNGYDIAFYSDVALTTKLFWETEKYVSTTGECIFWVKVPTLSASANTVIYIAYGNPSISTFQSTSTSVWDSNFNGVWHFPNGTTLTANDSTTNARNGTIVGATATTGKIDGGANFNATINTQINYSAIITPLGAKSVSTWLKWTTSNFTLVVANATNGNTTYGFTLIVQANIICEIQKASAVSKVLSVGTAAALNDGNWNQIYFTWDGTTSANKAILYIDGSVASTGTASQLETNTPSQNLHLGYYDNANDFTGAMDELKISNIPRSSSWVKAEYNNQNSPSTFFTLGARVSTNTGNQFFMFMR